MRNANPGFACICAEAKLYRLEKQIKGVSIDERYRIKQEKAVPLLAQFKAWLDKSSRAVLPDSLLGRITDVAV